MITKKKTEIVFVNGYDDGTPLSTIAVDKSLNERFAIIFSPLIVDRGACFNHQLLLDFLHSIVSALEPSQVILVMEAESEINLEEYTKLITTNGISDIDAPDNILLYQGEELICVVETEFWVYSGGQLPYADSYTLSFYASKELVRKIMTSCLNMCGIHHIPFKVLDGSYR